MNTRAVPGRPRLAFLSSPTSRVTINRISPAVQPLGCSAVVALCLFVGVESAHALTITNVQITPSDHGVQATFDTDVPAQGFITVSNASGGERSIDDGAPGLTHHQVSDYDDSFYAARTSYQLLARAQTAPNTPIVSVGPFSFTTAADVTPPVIQRVQINSVGSHSTVITVESDTYPGVAFVDYGPTLSYGQLATGLTTSTELCGLSDECRSRQRVILTNLQPLNPNQFQVRRDDGSGNQSIPSGNWTLMTDTLWTQEAFLPTPQLYGSRCAVVGDASGCFSGFQAYIWPQEMSWTGNELLVYFNVSPEDLTRGSLVFEVNVTYAQQVSGKWVQLEVAGGTNPASLVVINPGGVVLDTPRFYSIPVQANIFAPGLNYLRLRATTITSSDIGYGRVAPVAVWDRMQLRFAQLSAPALTDPQLLNQAESQAARYFWEQAFNSNGFVRDTTNAPKASVAATGFGLAALVVMADRAGSSPEWTVSAGEAQARAQKILDAAVATQNRQLSESGLYGKAGFLYHFVEPDGRRFRNLPFVVGQSQSDIEVSTVDMALLAAGALTAGQYFGGSVQTRANELFAKLDWTYFYNTSSGQFHHAWRPEYVTGFEVSPPDGSGRLSNQTWDRPSDETLLVNLLALASNLSSMNFRKSLYGWLRVTRRYAGYDVVNSYFGSLFTYLFGQCFFDFDAMGPDNPAGVGSSVQTVDWFVNAQNAARANRQFAIDHAVQYPTYDQNQWGLSACYRPDGPPGLLYFGDNGANPSEIDGGNARYDGTVPPYGAISTMPLLRSSPTETLGTNPAFQALRNYYTNHFSGLWGAYGPRDSFKTRSLGGSNMTAYSPLYVGIDVGPEALMLENYRSKVLYRAFMHHPKIEQAVVLQFPQFQPNRPPILAPIGTKTVSEGQLLSFTLSASDPDGDRLTYSASGLSAGATLTGPTFNWTPSYSQAGSYSVTFTVSDGVLTDSKTATVTVLDAPPAVSVAGAIHYYAGSRSPVGVVTVTMQGPTAINTQTDAEGAFRLTGVEAGQEWRLIPQKLGGQGSGISALDATYVLQSLVGLRPPLDAQQQLACDVTGNGSLSAFDAALILQYKVGLLAKFPIVERLGSDWVFLPTPAPVANQQLIMPDLANGQPGAIVYNPLQADATDQDFTAILFGDCTGNWQP